MPSSYFSYKHKKTATKITIFLIVVIIISTIIGVFFPDINDSKLDKNRTIDKVINDTIRK